MSGFHADIGRLAAKAGEFDEHAAKAQRIADALRAAVESAGDCWGHDEVGEGFARAHCPAARRAMDELGEIPGRLRGIGAKFAATARTHQQADAEGAGEIGRSAGQG
ncbi:hypothetical protein [Saccharopolyspora rosea]|uniref:Excreted virulence factor EspC, type VII ESX diderm n=1 Tax=Saccharopolyspora rosea TaxID=524884 RepID=A0ABW3G3C1_9PSEU|nr:hypothetical protein [Saccharopolyspora rosea]